MVKKKIWAGSKKLNHVQKLAKVMRCLCLEPGLNVPKMMRRATAFAR